MMAAVFVDGVFWAGVLATEAFRRMILSEVDRKFALAIKQ
jgi:hypothetical protein